MQRESQAKAWGLIGQIEQPIDRFRGIRLRTHAAIHLGGHSDGVRLLLCRGPLSMEAMNFANLPPLLKASLVRIIIETPKGSRNKLAYDPDLKIFVLKKTLPEGMVFPFDFGFIPQTKAEDGDPLDALVLMPESLPPGTAVACRIVGVIQARQADGKGKKRIRNDRYLAVSEAACEFQNLHDPDDLPGGMLEQLEKFFINYNELEGRQFKLVGVKGPKVALKAIRSAVKKANR